MTFPKEKLSRKTQEKPMNKAEVSKGHRWTTDELKQLMKAWVAGDSLEDMSKALNTTRYALSKKVVELRQNGIPLPRRNQGHVAGNRNKPWTQSEIEFVVRRRKEKATTEQIGMELGRSFLANQGIVQALRKNGGEVPMFGSGKRRLWDADMLNATLVDLKEL